MGSGWAALKLRVHYQSLGLQGNVCLGSLSKGTFNLVGGRHTDK